MGVLDDWTELDRHQRGQQLVWNVSGHRNHPEQLCAAHAHQVMSQHHDKNILGLQTGLIGPETESNEPQASKAGLGRCEACARQLDVGRRQLKPTGTDDYAPSSASPYTTKKPSGFFRPRQHEVAPFRPPLPASLNALDEDDEIAEEGHLTPEHYKKLTFTDYPGRDISYVHQALTHREPHYMKALTDDVRRSGIQHPIEIAHHDNDEWEVGGGHHRAAVAWHLGLTAPYIRTQEHGDWDPGERYHTENTRWRERRKEHPEEQQAYMRRGEADDPLKGKWAAQQPPEGLSLEPRPDLKFNRHVDVYHVHGHGFDYGEGTQVQLERSNHPDLNHRLLVHRELPAILPPLPGRPEKPRHEDIGRMSYHPETGRVEGVQTHDKYARQGVATGLWNIAVGLHEQHGLVRPQHSENQTPEGAAWAQNSRLADKHGVPGGEVFNCACGLPVEYDPIDGWQHTDGSISHDGELYGKSVSDLMGSIRPRSARFTPTRRVFTHTCGLDHRIFDAQGHLKPEVRAYVMGSIIAMWATRYREWSSWARIYFAGSEASEWTSDTLEGNNDFDVLIGVDYHGFRKANPAYAHASNQAITDEMNQGFRSFNRQIMLTVDGIETGPWDRTTYVNPDSYDIRAIKPYAAYDVGRDEWVVKPPHLPHWSLDDLPKSTVKTLRAADAYAHSILKLPEPERTQQGAALFDAWHSDRSRAFGPMGEGWYDIANLREKWLDQEGIWAELVDCKHRFNEGLGAAPAGWSNTPPGYTAKLAIVQPGSLPSRQQDAFDDPDFDAHRRKILDVAKQPEPGTRIWRGELRSAAEHPHEMTSVGMHWSTNPDAIVNPVAHSGREHRAVVFQGVLDHPEEQSIPRSHPMWSGQHGYSMDHEAEVRTAPGAKVRLEGAYVHNGHPDPGSVVPAHPERTGPGWDWHPLDHHATVEPKGKIQYHAALPKTQKCKYCEQQATQRVVHSEGMAYIPVCDKHLAKGEGDAAKSVPYGEPDPSNINAIRPIAVTMPYIRNNSGIRQHAPSGFGQEHEPWGRYMSPHGGHVPEGWEHGEVDFTNPLHVEHNHGEWKQQLSEQHGGASGKDLSRALLAKGHDAVITHDEYGINEMVDLRSRDQRTHRVANYAEYARDAWNRKADDPRFDWSEEDKARFRANGENDYRYHSTSEKHHQGEDWPGVGWVRTDQVAKLRHRQPDSPEHWTSSSPEVVRHLREGFRNGEGWEHPIQVHYHPGSHTSWMGEGNHRLRAAEQEGHSHVPVAIRLDEHRSRSAAPAPFPKPRVQTSYGDREIDQADLAMKGTSNGRIHPKHLLPAHWLADEGQQHQGALLHEVGTWWITPQLMVGRTPKGINHARRVASPEEAMRAIADGFTAVLPQGSWVAVRRILQLMGLNQLDIQQRLDLAQSGRVDA